MALRFQSWRPRARVKSEVFLQLGDPQVARDTLEREKFSSARVCPSLSFSPLSLFWRPAVATMQSAGMRENSSS
jgi:hypothetical protein